MYCTLGGGVIGSETTGETGAKLLPRFTATRPQGSEGSVATCVTATCETAQNAVPCGIAKN